MLAVSLEHSKCPFVWCHNTAFGLPTKLPQPEWPNTEHCLLCQLYWDHRIPVDGGKEGTRWFPLSTECPTHTHPPHQLPLAQVSQPKVQTTVLNICVNRIAGVAWWYSVQTVHWPQQSERCWEARTYGFSSSNYCGRLAVVITGGR